MDEQPTRADDKDERLRQVAERLREAREYLGLSQQFVAEQTGIPRVAMSAIESGDRRVDALELEALVRLYKYPVTYFLDGALETPASVQALAREAETLTERDRHEVLRFAQFLKAYGQRSVQESTPPGPWSGPKRFSRRSVPQTR